MDISETLIGKSDQLDNVDLLSGPRDFTIKAVRGGNTEQPLNIDLVEFPRPWRPGLTMRRLLAAVWGTTDASTYVGKRVRLYRDPEITFGKSATGGTRISHASHIEQDFIVSLPLSRGQFKEYTVHPLPDDASQGHASPGGITPDHERVIKEHMQRAKITPARVLELAQEVTGREIKKARELSSVEADALIVVLTEHVDPEEN